MTFFDDWLKNIQTAVVGPHCVLCRAPAPWAYALCDGCRADLPVQGPACRHCALALGDTARTDRCADCARGPRFDAAVAAFAYREPVRWLIARLKFNARLAHARLLGDLLAERVTAAELIPPQALIPVPLHRKGYRRRGFDQAERIAARLANRLNLPLDAARVTRIRATARQSELAAARRMANVRGAFACAKPLPYRHVAIVDDVVTTTHTAAAVAAQLRTAGATRVDLYCVARA